MLVALTGISGGPAQPQGITRRPTELPQLLRTTARAVVRGTDLGLGLDSKSLREPKTRLAPLAIEPTMSPSLLEQVAAQTCNTRHLLVTARAALMVGGTGTPQRVPTQTGTCQGAVGRVKAPQKTAWVLSSSLSRRVRPELVRPPLHSGYNPPLAPTTQLPRAKARSTAGSTTAPHRVGSESVLETLP